MQIRMLFLFNENDEVARRAASFSCVSPSPHTQLHSFLYAGGDIDGDCFFTIYPSFAFTYGAFGGDGRAFAVTGGASGDCLHLAQEGTGDLADLAAAAAGRAGLYAAFVFGAAATAGIAADIFFNLDIFGDPFGYFFVVELDLYTEVASPDTS